MTKSLAAAAALALACAALPAQAVDGVSVEIGAGDDSTEMGRVGVLWKWDRKWFTGGSWHVGGYWDLQLGYWNGQYDIVDIGLTPVFRLERADGTGPYLEGAIGFHLLSKTKINDNRRFSTAFQFGDHVGAGVRFGPQGRYDLGIRLQHLSNGSIKKPNSGINFGQLRFAYRFN